MSISREHFEAIAAIIRDVRCRKRVIRNPVALEATGLIASNLANVLKTFNPRFQRDQFLAACGVEPSTTAPSESLKGRQSIEALGVDEWNKRQQAAFEAAGGKTKRQRLGDKK